MHSRRALRAHRLRVGSLVVGAVFLLGSGPGTGREVASLPATTGTPDQGYLVTVAASWEPVEVHATFEGRAHPLPEVSVGSGTWFVPPGISKAEAFITGECSGGCGDPCFDDSVFVRAVDTRFVPAWQLTSETASLSDVVGASDKFGAPRVSVRVRSTSQPLITVAIKSWCLEEPSFSTQGQWADCATHSDLTEVTELQVDDGPDDLGNGEWGFTLTFRNTDARFLKNFRAGEKPDKGQVHFEVTAVASGYCDEGVDPCEPSPEDSVSVIE